MAEAFSRPLAEGASLQRPPTMPEVLARREPESPWRDPVADVLLGQPAQEPPPRATIEHADVPQFTLRQALFQRRLRLGTLVSLALIALVIGAGGAAAGVFLGSRTVVNSPDPIVTLAKAQPAVERAPGSVADIAARVLPAVVSIEVRVGSGGETGSGIVVDANGYILTNNHVISMAKDATAGLSVVFNDGAGTRHPGRIVGADPATDLAVVKVDGVHGLTVADLGDSEALKVGDSVIAVGSPLGLTGTVTTGIVSALHRPVRLGAGGAADDAVIDAIQTDAAVNPGNSGGPLVDASGAVVGINTAIRTLSNDPLSGGSIGLGFAIPINAARAVADTLIAHGTVVHPTLGLNVRSATDGSTDGSQVQNVVDGGPAAKAGIKEADVIVAIADRPVRSADEMVVAIQRYTVGDTVPVTLLRDGKRMTVNVTLGAA
ncbi:MAG: trypsin-like peptidase domain-containing protein [Nakamurella sp.]